MGTVHHLTVWQMHKFCVSVARNTVLTVGADFGELAPATFYSVTTQTSGPNVGLAGQLTVGTRHYVLRCDSSSIGVYRDEATYGNRVAEIDIDEARMSLRVTFSSQQELPEVPYIVETVARAMWRGLNYLDHGIYQCER